MMRSLKTFSNLVVLPHSVFALPFALASLITATNGHPPIRVLLLVILCMVLARTAAMAYNDGPCVVEAEVVKEDNVFPMIPAGEALSQMIIEPPREALAKPTGST